MQINSVNSQNSFGVKFGPKFRESLKKCTVHVLKGESDFGNRKISDKTQKRFIRQVQQLKEIFPDGFLEIENKVKDEIILTYENKKYSVIKVLSSPILGPVILREDLGRILKKIKSITPKSVLQNAEKLIN